MSRHIDIKQKQATSSSSTIATTYSNMTSSGSSSNTNNTVSGEDSRRKPRFNDSFDQPEEPFECDVSAILPVKRTGLPMSDYEDSEADSFNSDDDDYDINDQDKESFAPSEASSLQQGLDQHSHQHQQRQERESSHRQQQQDDIQARYLDLETVWSTPQLDGGGDYVDAQADHYLYQQVHGDHHQQHQEHEQDLKSNHIYSSHLYHDDELMGGHARLSTIAEISELPSINITTTRHHLQRHENAQSGPVVISGDLALEDLYVEGQDDLLNEEIRQQLMANLKPTDILGPLHETHDFKLSSLTHRRHPSEHEPERAQDQGHEYQERQEQQQEEEEREYPEKEAIRSEQSFERGEGESDLSSGELALKREFEAMFGSRGAIDSERGSDASGLLVYDNSEDMYQQDGDEDDEDEFFDEDDDEDDEDEEYYAMLDLNGGGGNMILGNNIPRKPRVLAPPAGSRLPVPGSAIKQKVPLALQSNIVSRVPAAKSSPCPPHPSIAPPPTQHAAAQRANQPPSTSSLRTVPASGLRVPQVAAKRAVSPPSVPTTATATTAPTTPRVSASQSLKASTSILDGLYAEDEQEQDAQPKESSGAVRARQYAEEILRREKRESELAAAATQGAPMPSMLRPPSKIPSRTGVLPQMPVENDVHMLQWDAATPLATTIAAPRSISVSTAKASSITPPKKSAHSSIATTTAKHTQPFTPASKSPSMPASTSDSAGRSSPRPAARLATSMVSTKGKEQARISKTDIPRISGSSSPRSRPTSMYTTTTERQSPSVSRSASPVGNGGRMGGLRSSMYEHPTRSPAMSRNVSPLGGAARLNNGLRSSMYEQSTTKCSPLDTEETPLKTSTLHRQSSKEKRNSVGSQERQDVEPVVRRTSYERKLQLQRELEEIEAEEAEEAELQLKAAQKDAIALERHIADAKKLSLRAVNAERERAQDPRRRSSRDLPSSSEYHHQSPHHRRSSERERESSAPASPLTPLSPRSPRSSGGISSKRSSLYSMHGDRLVPTLEESCKQLAKIRQDIAELREEIHQDQPEDSLSPRLPPSFVAGAAMAGRSSSSKRHSVREREEEFHGRRQSTDERRASYAHETTRLQQLGLGRSDSYNSSSVPSSPETKSASPPKRQLFGDILGKLSMSVSSRPAASSSSSHHHHHHHHHQNSRGSGSAESVVGTADGCPAQIRPKELRFSSSIAGEVQGFVTLFNRSRRQMRFEILRPAGITVMPGFGVIQPGRDQRLTVHLAENRGPGRVVVELDGEWLVPFGVAFD
ncbi:hypothetical protein BGX28_010284 [Mortierella sp. GBA30]|nr:hypothetical protein BGX28_010284 [Mortierella sp. GBA30]